jgi:hypothetical protein
MVYLAAAFIGLWLLVTLYVMYLGRSKSRCGSE